MRNRVRVDTTKLNRIMKGVDGNTGKVVRQVGFAVEREAKILAPIDLGPLKAGIYVRTTESNDMPDVPAPVNRVELPKPESKTTVTVGPSVDYGIFQELGTSKMAAQPYLTPAVRTVEQQLGKFYDSFGKALGDG